MINIKRILLVVAMLCLKPLFAQNQEVHNDNITSRNSWLKAGLTAGMPVGDADDVTSFNLGLDLRGQHMVTPNFGIGLASGYTHYFAEDAFEDFGVIPAAVFLRYYFQPKGLFFGSDVGYGFLTGLENAEGGLYINPQIGYHNYDWNFYAFYQNTFADNDFDLQSVGLGVTYNIRFN